MTTWVGQVESSAALASKEAIICHRMCQQQCLSLFSCVQFLISFHFALRCLRFDSELRRVWLSHCSSLSTSSYQSSLSVFVEFQWDELVLRVWRDAGDRVRSKLLPALIHWNYVSPMPRFKSSLALRSLVLVVKTKQTKNCVYSISKFKIHHLKRAHTRALPRISLQCTSLTYILCSKTAHIELCLCSEWSEIEIN